MAEAVWHLPEALRLPNERELIERRWRGIILDLRDLHRHPYYEPEVLAAKAREQGCPIWFTRKVLEEEKSDAPRNPSA